MEAGTTAAAAAGNIMGKGEAMPDIALGFSGTCKANREALLPPPALGHTPQARLWQVATVDL